MELMLLPSELLIGILIDLHFRDLLRCREVCIRFKTLIDEDFRARYTFELAVAGMVDGPSSRLTTAERLSILRIRQNAWNKFAWTAKERIPMSMGDVWTLYGNVLDTSLKQIPSAIRGIEGTEWVIPDMSCNMKDICLDPAQDFLVIIEDFWDRSLSTGAPYPDGPTTAMLTHKPKQGGYSYAIQTSEGYLGILMASQQFGDPSELLIWEWRIELNAGLDSVALRPSDRIPALTPRNLPPAYHRTRITSVFLTSRYILIAQAGHNLHEGTLDIVEPSNRSQLVVFDLESSDPVTLSELDYVCVFHYPRTTLMKHNRETVLLSLVPASTFLRVFATLVPGDTRHEFVWSEWGPARVAIHAGAAADDARVNMYGGNPGVGKSSWPCSTSTSSRPVRRRAGREGIMQERTEDITIVADATVLGPAGLFKEEVTTVLPYRQRVFAAPFERAE
ncbi:hypothetical protein LXA43DRAFT_1061804 [Ganoderma leucocontextum]|nr:hypothetical protein LXA43DRAFT_1061804 [Ganoderma leucocontextum]